MADTKITGLATGTTIHSDDWFVFVDIHDTSVTWPTGTNKKATPGTVSASLSITTSQVSDLGSWAGSTSLITLGTITTGTWTGSAINKAYLDATLVNTAGSYANPAWLTSLAGAKITGDIAGNAASITGSVTESQVTNLTTDLAAKAPLASPTFSGTVTLPVGLTGLIKAASGVVSAAAAGTDYLTPSGSGASLTALNATQITSGTLPAARLPNPSATTLGGIQSLASASSKWINAISTSGVPSATQPAFSDISGSVAAAQLPNPSATTLGGIQSLASVASKWINAISTSGVPSATQPAFTDISGSVAASQLPNPSASTLGGIQSYSAVANQFLNAISTAGVPSSAQPAFSNLSGTIAAGQIAAGTITPAMQANVPANSLRGNPTGSAAAPSDITLGPNLNFVGTTLRGRYPLWVASGPGTALTSSSALTSILAGASSQGSLTIPANALQVGSRLVFDLFGTYTYASGAPTLYIELALGGTIIGKATTAALSAVASNLLWVIEMVWGNGFSIQSTGVSGTIIGTERISLSNAVTQPLTLGTPSAFSAASAATIDTTSALTITVKMQWSGAGSTYSIQLLGGGIYLDG